MILQYKRVGWWSDKYWGYQKGGYYFGEIGYQILSLVAKTLLLWLVFGGTNQPNSYSGRSTSRGTKMPSFSPTPSINIL